MTSATAIDTRLKPLESRWHDALRLFLLAEVALGHMAAIALPAVPELRQHLSEDWLYLGFRLAFRFGGEAAFLFVFLSGFMVAGPMLARLLRAEPTPAREFFSKRFRRLAPVAVVAVLLTLVLDRTAQAIAGTDAYRHSYAGDMTANAGLWDLLGNLAFLQPVVVPSYGSNGPLWTLGYIAHYYVLGWMVLRVGTRHRPAALVLLAFLLVGMTIISPEWAILFVAWLAGGVARLVGREGGHAVPLLAVAGVVFVASNVAPSLVAAALTIPVGLLLSMGLARSTRLSGVLDSPQLRRVSNESFTIYAVHHPVLMAVFAIGFDGSVDADLSFVGYVLASTACVAVVALLAGGLVRALSRPVRPMGDAP